MPELNGLAADEFIVAETQLAGIVSPMSRTFKAWVVSLGAIALFTWISFLWVDKPVALWVAKAFGQRQLPVGLSETPVLSLPLIASGLFVVLGIVALAGRRFSKTEMTIAMTAISTLATIVVKDQLKFVFGRTWPDSWGPGVLSLVQNNVYGFHFFQSGKAFESFPSGHSCVAAAILSLPYIMFPKLRVACAVCLLAIDIGLVVLNLHFVSDVVAGNFVGCSTGLFVVAFWRARSAEAEPR